MTNEKEFDYDLAFSFAGEDREYVESIAEILKELGVSIFYDKYYEAELWGKDLYTHLDQVYRLTSKYCLMFLSQSYEKKLWTDHERASAQARAFNNAYEYILPIKLDDTEIPGIRPTVGYLDSRQKTKEEIVAIILTKLGRMNELDGIIDELESSLGEDWVIKIQGHSLNFKNEVEDFEVSYPTRLFIELNRTGLLKDFFLKSSILPL